MSGAVGLAIGPAIGLAVFVAVVVVSITRPRGIPEWAAAVAGAAVVLAVGLVGLGDAASAVAADWNVLLFFVGMTGLAAVAERSGFFEAAALLALRAAGGSGHRLLVAVLLVGVATTTVLSNDATALILTPVVYRVVVALGVDALPYVLACTFVADGASLLLPVSNPVNILVMDGAGIAPGRYLVSVGPAAVAAAGLTVIAFLWYARRSVPRRLRSPDPSAAAPVAPRRSVWLGLAVIAVAFVGGGIAGASLGIVACGGFAMLLVLEAIESRRVHRRPWEGVSWRILLYVSGMVVLVAALQRQGLVEGVAGFALSLGGGSAPLTAAVSSVVAAAGSNLVNNVPMTLVMVNAIQAAHLAPAAHDAAAFGAIAGADLGPNLTPVGSLATVLWLLILRERGLDVRPVDYLRFGLLSTPPILLVATALVAFR